MFILCFLSFYVCKYYVHLKLYLKMLLYLVFLKTFWSISCILRYITYYYCYLQVSRDHKKQNNNQGMHMFYQHSVMEFGISGEYLFIATYFVTSNNISIVIMVLSPVLVFLLFFFLKKEKKRNKKRKLL